MQILHPFAGSVQQYAEELRPRLLPPRPLSAVSDPQPLTAHGFYTRTLIDTAFDGMIHVRRYLCRPASAPCPCYPSLSCPTCAAA